MNQLWPLFLLVAAFAPAQNPVREMVYPGAVTAPNQVVPTYDKGHLLYLHLPNRLEVFRPDGKLAFNLELPCPGSGTCSAAGAAVNPQGHIAVSLCYSTQSARACGIRILSSEGRETRFIETGQYVPLAVCFDHDDNLWSLGWQRDAHTDDEERQDYPLVRKFSGDGTEIGRYISRQLWRSRKAQPGRIGRGYWRMQAASDRIGAMIHESHADNPAEWLEWDLNGNLLSRTEIPSRISDGRAYTSDGRLYGRFGVEGSQLPELRMLDRAAGTWLRVAANVPEAAEGKGAFLLRADCRELVYRVGHGNVRLLRVRPGDQ